MNVLFQVNNHKRVYSEVSHRSSPPSKEQDPHTSVRSRHFSVIDVLIACCCYTSNEHKDVLFIAFYSQSTTFAATTAMNTKSPHVAVLQSRVHLRALRGRLRRDRRYPIGNLTVVFGQLRACIHLKHWILELRTRRSLWRCKVHVRFT